MVKLSDADVVRIAVVAIGDGLRPVNRLTFAADLEPYCEPERAARLFMLTWEVTEATGYWHADDILGYAKQQH